MLVYVRNYMTEKSLECIVNSFEELNNLYNNQVYLLFGAYNPIDTIETKLVDIKTKYTNNVHLYIDKKEYYELESITKIRDILNNVCIYENDARIMNQLMDELKKEPFLNSDFVIHVPCNIVRILPIEQIYLHLESNIVFDAIIGLQKNIINDSIQNVDSFRDNLNPFGKEVLGNDYNQKYLKELETYIYKKEHLSPIISYNGLIIWNYNSIQKGVFNIVPTLYIDAHYRTKCDKLIIPTTYDIQGSPLGMFYFENQVIFYRTTERLNTPIVDMFHAFHQHIAYEGHNQLFLSKSMFCYIEP